MNRVLLSPQLGHWLLNRTAGEAAPLAFSMVMIEPMLWTRYAATDGQAKATIHTEGAEPGELVVVSAEDVIVAIGNGHWTIQQAYDAGLLGLHGRPAAVKDFLARYGGNP